MSQNIITIDGPSGAGKSTITRLVASRLGLRYLDTGAMYRAATLHCMRSGIRLDDPMAVAKTIKTLQLDVELVKDGPVKVRIGGQDVTDKIRTPEVTRNIHHVADIMEVRDWLVNMQRKIGEQGDLVTEGRDQGTLVFPHADLKVYLFASHEVRAKRRFEELKARGMATTLDEVLKDVSQRDHLDMSREHGGLRKALDAVEVDTSTLTPDEVAESIIKLAKGRLAMRTRKIDKAKLGLDKPKG